MLRHLVPLTAILRKGARLRAIRPRHPRHARHARIESLPPTENGPPAPLLKRRTAGILLRPSWDVTKVSCLALTVERTPRRRCGAPGGVPRNRASALAVPLPPVRRE